MNSKTASCFWIIIVILFTVACSSYQRFPLATETTTLQKVSTVRSIRTPTISISSPTLVLTKQAASVITPTPTRLLTITATATPTVLPTDTLHPTPEVVWLPWDSGTYSNPPAVLTIRSGIPQYEPFPVRIESFWDYSKLSGRLAYSTYIDNGEGTEPSLEPMNDLWVYDYTSATAELWFTDSVHGASWSPVIDPKTNKQLLGVTRQINSGLWELVILTAPHQIIATIPNACPHFSWSPDGQKIAFLRWPDSYDKQGLYVTSPSGDDVVKIGDHLNPGYWYPQPIWAQEHNAIFYDAGRTRVAFLDGSEGFYLPEQRSPYMILWDSQKRQIIMGFEGGEDSTAQIIIYGLSENLRWFTSVKVIPYEGRLVGWYEPNKSIILAKSSTEAVIWSLEKEKVISP